MSSVRVHPGAIVTSSPTRMLGFNGTLMQLVKTWALKSAAKHLRSFWSPKAVMSAVLPSMARFATFRWGREDSRFHGIHAARSNRSGLCSGVSVVRMKSDQWPERSWQRRWIKPSAVDSHQ